MRWTVHGERWIYESEWVGLSLVDVEQPSGARYEHHVVRMPAQAAGVVVMDDDRGVLLLWRHRFITDSWGWEVPAGRIDAGETPLAAGGRETLEETGWEPGPMRPLASYHARVS
jgi:8-oxo-dGTP pyrophosphatase MutT (NUDIX family)